MAVGLAAGVAATAATAGSRVELVGRVGEDRAGDALLLALARAGVGHAAMLRDPSGPTVVAEDAPDRDGAPLVALEPEDAAVAHEALAHAASIAVDRAVLDDGDIDLALGYLLDTRVVVVAQPLTDAAARAVASSAAFTDATLVAVVPAGDPVPAGLDRAIVFELDSDGSDEFAELVGRFAASLDAGTEPAAAFVGARDAAAWGPVEA
jgi:hypothetical protein